MSPIRFKQSTLAASGSPDSLQPSQPGHIWNGRPSSCMSRDEDVFAEALEVPAPNRAAFLDRACAGDAALRERIVALLAGYQEAERAMPRALVTRSPGPASERPSERIGRYKLLEKIGEGGCGVVWMAEQEEPVRRRVALKVIKLGMDTKAVIARFEAERQALALMDHPNIARVFDAGATESGRPFFAMELVRGVPITTYCDKHHLPPRARLELFIAVCAAVQHAHQKGIIHRDIKPSNILVTVNDGVAVPKVIDFGIAKAMQGRLTEHTLFTAFEQFMGTPVYMSPEQAEMSSVGIDPRSDVYSLGVLLYELLTGQPPFDAKAWADTGVDEIRRRIREVEPPKPSTRWRTLTDAEQASVATLRGTAPAELSGLLRGDLDWIVMRCLEKERARRYESPSALAADLERHLRHEPVAARPPSPAYVVGRFFRRHRAVVVATAAVLVALVAGSTVSTWRARRADDTATPALPSRSAPAPLSPARQLIAKARAMSLDKYDSTADDYAAAEGLLKQALALDQNDADLWAFSSLFNTSIRTRGFDHAAVRREMARRDAERALKLAPDSVDGLFALGRTQRDFEPDAAEQTFKKILARNPDEVRALDQLAWIYDQTGRPDEAVSLYERVVAADPEHAALVRYTEFLLFFHYRRFAEADRAIRQSIAIQPSANSHAGLAMLLLTWRGDADEAARVLATGPTAARNEPRTIGITALVQLYRRAPDEALKALDRLADDFIQDNWFAGPKAYFTGRAHALAGRTEAARIAWESALAVTNRRLKDAPSDRTLHLMRGQLLAWLGSPDEALREARAVAELVDERADWYWFYSPALIYAALGRADDALPLLQKISAAPAGKFVSWPLTPALLRLDPIWDGIRDDPRFQKLATSEVLSGSAPAKPEEKSAPASPATVLANRAQAIYDSTGFGRDELTLADDLARRATDMDPASAHAWGVRAMVQAAFLYRGFSIGADAEQRSRDAQSFGNRALALDPDEVEALLALGRVAGGYRRAFAQSEEILARALAAHPEDNRIRRALALTLRSQPDRFAEGMGLVLEAVQRDPRDPLAHYDLANIYRGAQDFPAAWRENEAALALQSFGTALTQKAGLALEYKGDVAGMRTVLNQLSPSDQSEDRAVFNAMFCGLVERRPERVITAAALNSRDYFEDNNTFAGPKAWLTALAYQIGGQENSARQQWQQAERVLRGRLLGDPQSHPLRLQLAITLARMGRLEEAKGEIDPIEAVWREQADHYDPRSIAREQSNRNEARLFARYYASTGEAAKAVGYLRPELGSSPIFAVNTVRLDPWWDKLRGTPEFDSVLANPPPPPAPIAPAPYRGKPGSPVTRAEPPVAPSEAAQLAARAYALTQRLGFSRDDLAVAAGLTQRATELEPALGRAWAVRAWVHACYAMRNWDNSERKLQEVQALAQRALAIEPRDADAMNALYVVLEKQEASDEAVEIARRAIEVAPDNYRSYLCLGRALQQLKRHDESVVVLQKAVTRFPDNPLCRYELASHYASIGYVWAPVTPGSITASLEQLDAALAVGPFSGALLLKAATLGAWRGDLVGMRREIDRLATMPLADRTEDRAVFMAMWTGLLERRAEPVLAAAKLTARPYFEDGIIAGPKAWGTALAYRLQGKESLARQEWLSAEATLRQRLQDPAAEGQRSLGRGADTVRLATTLAWLGRLDEAAQLAGPMEAIWKEDMNPAQARALALYYAARGDAAKAVPYLRQSINTNTFLTDSTLPLDPWWDKLRGRPEFEEILKTKGLNR